MIISQQLTKIILKNSEAIKKCYNFNANKVNKNIEDGEGLNISRR